MKRRGFTITELLVVIGVITLLMGLLLTGLQRARSAGRNTKQLSDARQVFTAWTMYAGQSADECLPGFMSEDVQAAWKLKYKMNVTVPGQSNRFNAAVTQTYPWRLMPFLDYNWESMMNYRGASDDANPAYSVTADTISMPAGATLPTALQPLMNNTALLGRTVALQPGFGYNAYYLGGWWNMNTASEPTPEPAFNQVYPTANVAKAMGRDVSKTMDVITRKVSNVRRPEQMVAFSASSILTTQTKGYSKPDSDAAGAAWCCPTFLGTTPIWKTGFSGGGSITLTVSQAVPLSRYSNEIGTVFVDGSTSMVNYGQLADMRSWINLPELPNAQNDEAVHSGKP
jgi:prepilin-type N-terminal cleavage/methylation domain-containing protein